MIKERISFVSTIEKVLFFTLLISFAMPYVRIGLDGFVWPNEYAKDSVRLPRIIEFLVLLVFLFQLTFKKISTASVSKMGKVFFMGLILLFYTSIFHPLLSDIFFPFHVLTLKGGIRTNIALPLIAYVVGFHLNASSKKTTNIIIISLLGAGLLQAIAMLSPVWFPDYMITGNFGVYDEWSSSGKYLGKIQREAGFYFRSTDAANFTVLLVGFVFSTLSYIQSKPKKIIMYISLFIFTMALMSSMQRMPFIAFIGILLLVFMFKRHEYGLIKGKINSKIQILIFGGIIIFGIIQIPYLLQSRMTYGHLVESFMSDYRWTAVWPAYINFVLREPLVLFFGAGYGSEALDATGYSMHMAHAHNQYLSWLSGIGLPMTIVFIFLFLTLYKYGNKCMSSTVLASHEKIWGRFMVTSLLAIMIISLGESPLLAEPISILIFLIGGITTSMFSIHVRRSSSFKAKGHLLKKLEPL